MENTEQPNAPTEPTPENNNDVLKAENTRLQNELDKLKAEQNYNSLFSNIKKEYADIVKQLSETQDINQLSENLKTKHPEFYQEKTKPSKPLQNEIINDVNNFTYEKQKEITKKQPAQADPEKMKFLKNYKKKWGL